MPSPPPIRAAVTISAPWRATASARQAVWRAQWLTSPVKSTLTTGSTGRRYGSP